MGYAETNAFAASICGIKPIPRVIHAPVKLPNMAVDPSKLKGLYEYQYETGMGLHIDCFLEYEKAYDGGDPSNPSSEESYPESITLIYALVNGVDISEVIEDSDTQKLIEDEALAAIQTDAFNVDLDRADHAYEMRRAA